MRKIVICGWVLGALVLGACDEKSSGSGGEAPSSSASANSATVPPANASANAKTEPGDKDKEKDKNDKEKKAEGPKDHATRAKAVDEAFSTHDAKKLSALYAEDAVIKSPGMPDTKGREGIEKNATQMFGVFKDVKLTHGRIWEKDKHTVVVESVYTGTNTGDAPEMGIPKATNKTIGVVGASWYEVGDDGLIKEEHRYYDHMTVLGQLNPDKDKKNPVRAVVTAPPDGMEQHKAKTEEEAKSAKEEKEKTEIAKALEAQKKNVEVEDKVATHLSAGKLDEGLKLFAEDVVYTDYSTPTDAKGKKALKEMLGAYWTAFPDMKTKISGAFGDGDFVIFENDLTGTQKGPLGSIKATNKTIDVHQLEVDQLKDGKIVKGWAWGNNAELLGELGVLKDPGAAPAPPSSAKPATPK